MCDFAQRQPHLFVKRQNTGFCDGCYGLPAGHVEHGESFRQAAAREALEEVGAIIKPEQLRFVHLQQTYKHDDDIRAHVFFEADAWEGELKNREPDKHSEIAWLSADNLPLDALMPLATRGLQCILRGEVYDEFGWRHSAAV